MDHSQAKSCFLHSQWAGWGQLTSEVSTLHVKGEWSRERMDGLLESLSEANQLRECAEEEAHRATSERDHLRREWDQSWDSKDRLRSLQNRYVEERDKAFEEQDQALRTVESLWTDLDREYRLKMGAKSAAAGLASDLQLARAEAR